MRTDAIKNSRVGQQRFDGWMAKVFIYLLPLLGGVDEREPLGESRWP